MHRLITAILILATGCTSELGTSVKENPSQPANPATEIISVGDGDTLRVNQDGETVTIRLGCIDAPETAQTPWGEQSANRLKQILPTGQAVQVREIDRDRYGRTVAEVFLGNQSVNLMMVKEGQAVVYRQYLSGCANTQDQYLQAESQAKAQGLGFWNQSNPVMPWDFRRGRSNAVNPTPASTPTTTSNCDPSYPDVCIPSSPPDLDCGDISERNFRVTASDPHRFDGDKDGLGCES